MPLNESNNNYSEPMNNYYLINSLSFALFETMPLNQSNKNYSELMNNSYLIDFLSLEPHHVKTETDPDGRHKHSK